MGTDWRKGNNLPPCCQPDSDCAEEIRKGNPPPCKVDKEDKDET